MLEQEVKIMINKKVRIFVRFHYLIRLLCIMAIASSCALPSNGSFQYPEETPKDDDTVIGMDPQDLFSTADTNILAWDAPPFAVDTYKVLLRVHNTEDWLLLQDNISAAGVLEYIVLHEPTLNGVWDFGVVAVDDMSEESAVHNSLDVTADPNSGWYLIWDY